MGSLWREHQGTRKGKRGAPPPSPPLPTPSPPDPRTAGGRPGGRRPCTARPGGRPPPRGPRHPGRGATAAVRAAVRRLPPVSGPPTPAVPAVGQQHCARPRGHSAGPTRTEVRRPVPCGGRGNDEATRLGARPGRAERRTAAERPSRPPPRRAPRPSPRGGAAHRPPPPPPPDGPTSSPPDRARRPGLPNSPGRACSREGCAAPRRWP